MGEVVRFPQRHTLCVVELVGDTWEPWRLQIVATDGEVLDEARVFSFGEVERLVSLARQNCGARPVFDEAGVQLIRLRGAS